jgi:hypothetical protein
VLPHEVLHQNQAQHYREKAVLQRVNQALLLHVHPLHQKNLQEDSVKFIMLYFMYH